MMESEEKSQRQRLADDGRWRGTRAAADLDELSDIH